jgi:transcriptional regulator with XRE-family HTH domain
MASMDVRSEIREFLSSRRARISPAQAGLPAYGGNRRVKGLRREEVAMLAGVSVDYYVRMERGNLSGASENVLDALASALQLDEAERDHLYALARESGTGTRRRTRKTQGNIRPSLQQVLDAITDAPAWIRNGRHDVLAMNQLARALYAPVLADPRRPANTTRFVYLNPAAAEQFFVDYDQIARDAAAMLRLEAGRNPHDEDLIALVGELSTRSELFRQRWPPRMCGFIAPAASGCATPSSVNSTWTSRRWSCRRSLDCSSTSIRRPRTHRRRTASSCSLHGPPARKTFSPKIVRATAEVILRVCGFVRETP